MKKVLITGGAGSVGRELGLKLAAKGYEVTAFDIPQARYEGLEELGIKCIKGDITDAQSVMDATEGCDVAVHLAGILPPYSEANRDRTMAVNVLGTKNLVDALKAHGTGARIIFSSTVAVYGDTTGDDELVTDKTERRPNSVYACSKAEAEDYILASGVTYTILRVGAVMVTALADPPVWPFMPEQRMEFIYRDDVAVALQNVVEREESSNKVLIISGGKSWQMKGCDFVKRYLEVLDYPLEDAEYPDHVIYSDYYDTDESQRLLEYQNTSLDQFFEIFRADVERQIASFD